MPVDLAIQIRSELYKKEMSQSELAKMLGISGAYLTDILKGRRTGPKAQEHIMYIKKILEIK
ncbi:helix-turn-helix domain-containing protein [Kurthia populi]|uniref:Helix-turn-helix domain-containing protein n=1 Tax=Kurthia populi TaxID=1562132 RepID=A0ABW5Y3L9_9BACL|nr:helix-turn-helix transcriptional regulator [Kurthia sp. Dielmo]